MVFHYSFLCFLVLCYSLLPLFAEDGKMEYQANCPASFKCGEFGNLHFPFTNDRHPDCGLPITGCDDLENDKAILTANQTWYIIESINGNNSIYVRDGTLELMLRFKTCDGLTHDINASLPPSSPILHFQVEMEYNITLLSCKNALDGERYEYIRSCDDYEIYYPTQPYYATNDTLGACSAIQRPVSSPTWDNSTDLYSWLAYEFRVLLLLTEDCRKCYEQGNQCEIDNGSFYCAVSKGGDSPPPKYEDKKAVPFIKIGLVAIGLVSVITSSLMVLFFLKRRKSLSDIQKQSNKIHCSPNQNPIPESGTVFLGIPVFTYTELEEATSNFDEARELGSGGYGNVYYGKLRDGREVAVKRLYEHNCRRMEQFMNEIEILTRLRHRNLVTLYGCSSRHNRELLLVYEYIPNGTLACHLHGDLAKSGFLSWPIRMRIAIETASALTYLHATGIIHRDVKTNNILLDNIFFVKVADFGLSRLFPNNATHVSTAPQGTLGYVDPAYHKCYQLTSKSDVYSFGVVLIELISSLKPIDITRNSDEVNLSYLATKKIKNRAFSELVDPSLGFELDKEIGRKTFSVAELAFQCLQENRDLRPSMVEVLDALKRIEGVEDKLNI